MKNILSFFTTMLLCAFVWAQAPGKLSYQAVVRGSNNDLITNQQVGMRFNILQGSASGVSVYEENHAPTTNDNGLVSISIGGGTVISGNFSAINWANGPYFIQVETDPNGGTNYSVMGTSQLLSVPYALYANQVANPQYQTLSISNDTIYLTNGGFVKLPAATSLGGFALPVLSTAPATNITSNTAVVSATLVNANNNIISEWGICYDTLPNPTVNDKKFTSGSGSSYTLHLNGDSAYLNSGTTYYARTYAITENNIHAYGNEISFSTLSVGQTGPASGTVFFDKGVYSNGWRYLEASALSATNMWGCQNTLLGGTSDSLGAGAPNTIAVLGACPFSAVFSECSNLNLNGYDDWFVPSKEEARAFRNFSLQGFFIWTSTENDAANAWAYDGNNDALIPYNKFGSVLIYYFPVRKF